MAETYDIFNIFGNMYAKRSQNHLYKIYLYEYMYYNTFEKPYLINSDLFWL
jgi:hypothetical protein